jgi:hypothetical protein
LNQATQKISQLLEHSSGKAIKANKSGKKSSWRLTGFQAGKLFCAGSVDFSPGWFQQGKEVWMVRVCSF